MATVDSSVWEMDVTLESVKWGNGTDGEWTYVLGRRLEKQGYSH